MGDISKPPTSPDELWLQELRKHHPDTGNPAYWSSIEKNAKTWAGHLSASPFWVDIENKLTHWKTEYYANHQAELVSSAGLPSFVSKSQKSIKEKLFRKYQNDPDSLPTSIATDGPPVPAISDLVRTRITCSYIDGVEFIAAKIIEFAKESDITYEYERQGKLEGYFAQHITLEHDFLCQLFGLSSVATIRVEIQIASEMATKMWDTSHAIYEGTRRRGTPPENWQWKPNDPRFISNQLGHMIHLVDGLLVQLRDSTKVKH